MGYRGRIGFKTVQDYEQEAVWSGDCLVHKSKRPDLCRIIYQRRHGTLLSNLFVLHTCDNRNCILDNHHFVGTQQDNVNDAMQKKRHSSQNVTVEVRIQRAELAIKRWHNNQWNR